MFRILSLRLIYAMHALTSKVQSQFLAVLNITPKQTTPLESWNKAEQDISALFKILIVKI